MKRTKQSMNREELESRILRSAEFVFAEKGYSGSSMEAIAATANISKQNLIYYFPNKELLYQRVLKEMLDIWIEKLSFLEAQGDTPEAVIRRYVREKCSFLDCIQMALRCLPMRLSVVHLS